MKGLIQDFTKHIATALNIGNNTNLSPCNKEIKNVLICGLGGSGIGGTIISQIVANNASLPITINKDYKIPAFVNDKTLVIISSYSGNTEETLEMLAQAETVNAEIACFTSGGELEEIAKEKGYNHMIIPGGNPPRAAFGLAFPQLFFILKHYNIVTEDYISQFESAIKLINEEEKSIITEAKQVADKLFGNLPVIYSDATFEGVSVRFRQQINENAKMLCWHHVIPEMNHNELVGWRKKEENIAVILFRNETDYYRTQKRMEINKSVIAEYTSNITEIYSKGSTQLERSLYLIHLGDWVSFILGEKKGVDITEVDVITMLKNKLSEL